MAVVSFKCGSVVTVFMMLLICISINTVTAQYEDMMGGMGGKGKKCSQFRCQDGGFNVQKRPLRLPSTGCSGGGGGMMMMNMGGSGSSENEPCCHQKQACYHVCGASKSKCDAAFDTCSKTRCQLMMDDAAQKKCDSDLQMQAMMSGFSGCKEFDEAQLHACDCVTKESQSHKRRKQTLTDFYKKFNKEKVSEVEKLHKKHGTSTASKFSKLLTKLVGKYPKAITVVRSKQQEMYEKIMKDGVPPEAKTAEANQKNTDEKSPPPPPADDGDEDVEEVDAEFEHDEM